MAWGYEKGFIIVHVKPTMKKYDKASHRISCKDCCYYEFRDGPCRKQPLYFPKNGRNIWKKCQYFELDHHVRYYFEKSVQYELELEKRKKEQEEAVPKKKASVVNKQKKENATIVVKSKKAGLTNHNENAKKRIGIKRLPDGFEFCVVETFPKGKKLKAEIVPIIKSSGSEKKIMIERDVEEKKVYISNKTYTREAIEKAYQVLNKKSIGEKQK